MQNESLSELPGAHNAVDAIRCLYLAKISERSGRDDAARRWREKADHWVNKLNGNDGEPPAGQPPTDPHDN